MSTPKVIEKMRQESEERAKAFDTEMARLVVQIVDRLYALQPSRALSERETIVEQITNFHIVMMDIKDFKLLERNEEKFLELIETILKVTPADIEKDSFRSPELPVRFVEEANAMYSALSDTDRQSIEMLVEKIMKNSASSNTHDPESLDNSRFGTLYTSLRMHVASEGKSTQAVLAATDEDVLDTYASFANDSRVQNMEVVDLSSSPEKHREHIVVTEISPEKESAIDERFNQLDKRYHQEAAMFVAKTVELLAPVSKDVPQEQLVRALTYTGKLAYLGYQMFHQSIKMDDFAKIPEDHQRNVICQLLKEGLNYAKNINLEGVTNGSENSKSTV